MKRIVLKASVTVYVLLILGLIIGMFLMGYHSPMTEFVANDVFTTDDSGQYTIDESLNMSIVFDKIVKMFTSKEGIMMMGISLGFAFFAVLLPGLGQAGGSILSVLIPAFLLFMFSNIFFFPVIGEPGRHGLPEPLSFLLSILFNVLLLLAILTFISGRE